MVLHRRALAPHRGVLGGVTGRIVKETRRIRALLVAFLGFAACEPSVPAATHRISLHIVDSTWAPPWDEMDDSIAVYRVAVRLGERTDTLRDVIAPWPIVVADSALFGLVLDRKDTT